MKNNLGIARKGLALIVGAMIGSGVGCAKPEQEYRFQANGRTYITQGDEQKLVRVLDGNKTIYHLNKEGGEIEEALTAGCYLFPHLLLPIAVLVNAITTERNGPTTDYSKTLEFEKDLQDARKNK